MSISTSTIDTMRLEMKRLKAEIQNKIKDSLKTTFAQFFQDHPEVKSIYWTQYTPGFNDGDPCVFSVGEIYYCPTMMDGHPEDYEGEEDGPFNAYGDDKRVSESLKDDMRAVTRFIGENSDMMEDLYGNNVAVTVAPDKVSIEEYDCGD